MKTYLFSLLYLKLWLVMMTVRRSNPQLKLRVLFEDAF